MNEVSELRHRHIVKACFSKSEKENLLHCDKKGNVADRGTVQSILVFDRLVFSVGHSKVTSSSQ